MWRVLALILAGICLSPASSRAETITLVADLWCPYTCQPDTKHPGFMVEIAQKAFAKHNINVEYSLLPWTRAIEEARKHKYTAIAGAAHTDAPDFLFPKIPQGRMRTSFFVKSSDTWRFTGIESLKKVSLGVIAGYTYNEALDAYIAAHKNELKYVQILSGDNALEANVKKLLAGRVTAIAEAEYVMTYTAAKNDWTDKLIHVGSLPSSKSDHLFIAFSPKEPKAKEYKKILAEETLAMRKSGELKKILDAYNVRDWEQ